MSPEPPVNGLSERLRRLLPQALCIFHLTRCASAVVATLTRPIARAATAATLRKLFLYFPDASHLLSFE